MFKLSIETLSKDLDDIIPSIENALEILKNAKEISLATESFVNFENIIDQKTMSIELDVKDLIKSVETEFELAQVIRDIRKKYGFDIKETVRKIKSGKKIEKEDMIFEQVICQTRIKFTEDENENIIIDQSIEEDDGSIL